jgi:hypothetical protein
MEENATQRLEARLDRQQYDDNQLITIKVPASYLSYFNVSTTFERVSGTIEVGGVPYQYVKRRIFNDSVEMMCIPNRTALKWRQSGISFFGLVNGVEREGSTSHPGISKSFLTDPYTSIEQMGLPQSGKSSIILGRFVVTHLASGFLTAGERPPAVSAA